MLRLINTLSLTWSQTLKTGFVIKRLIWSLPYTHPLSTHMVNFMYNDFSKHYGTEEIRCLFDDS